MAKVPTERQLAAWREAIAKNGVKRLQVRALIKPFGAERRGSAVLRRVHEWCAEQDPPLYANGLDHAQSLDDTVELAERPILQIGGLVEREEELTRRFEAEIMPQLGKLRMVQREFSPTGTQVRVDFLCQGRDGTKVVVELKRADGEQRSVEQVLSYMRALRKDAAHGTDKVRGVLITGRADLNTRRAREEIEADYQSQFDWYVYGIDDSGAIILQKVALSP